MQYNIIEIFDSLEGEGLRQGLAATFIRLAGCNLSCSWCDTKYASIEENIIKMPLKKILERVNKAYKRVTLTGGEPLISENIECLIKALIEDGNQVNIETNGSIDISKFRVVDNKNLFFTIDCKLITSCESEEMNWHNYFKFSNKNDCIKFIVGSEGDLKWLNRAMKSIISVRNERNTLLDMPQIYIGAVANKFDSKAIADYILENPLLKDAKLQVQLHKVIGVK